MSGDNVRLSSSEVASEAEDTRAHLASTLEQLRTNLRPENVVAEVVSNAKIGASTIADNVATLAKQYPIPSVLIAAGSALAAGLFGRRPAGDPSSHERSSLGPTPVPIQPRFAPAPGRDGFPTSADEGQDAGSVLSQRTAVRVVAPTRPWSGAADSLLSQAGDAMHLLSRRLPSDRYEAKSKLANLLEEQPLILGAIGLAVGAAIGAALPKTDAEDSFMGATSHRFRDTASEAARQEIDGLRVVASEAVETVRHSASDNLQNFAKDVGDTARTVVDRAGDGLAPPAHRT